MPPSPPARRADALDQPRGARVDPPLGLRRPRRLGQQPRARSPRRSRHRARGTGQRDCARMRGHRVLRCARGPILSLRARDPENITPAGTIRRARCSQLCEERRAVRSRLLFAPSCSFLAGISIRCGFGAGADEIIVGVLSSHERPRPYQARSNLMLWLRWLLLALITAGPANAQTPEPDAGPVQPGRAGRRAFGPVSVAARPGLLQERVAQCDHRRRGQRVRADHPRRLRQPMTWRWPTSTPSSASGTRTRPRRSGRSSWSTTGRPIAIVGRKSRGISDPKSLEGKRLGAPPVTATVQQWPVFAKLNEIDAGKVTLENIALPVRVPMLAAGQLDAALGYSFRLYVDLKDRGVPVGDIVQLQMADYKLKLYGAAIIVNSKFAAEQPDAVARFLRATVRGFRRRHPQSRHRGRAGAAPRRAGQEGRRDRAAAHGDPRERPHAGGARQRLRRDRSGADGRGDQPDRARATRSRRGRRPTRYSTHRSCRPRRRAAGELIR